MAGSTLLRRRIAAALVYAVLEWTLIALLLFNALLSYLIARFAKFFGLLSPCILCSRLDLVFEPGGSYGDLLCAGHVADVSRLGYFERHQRTGVKSGMCGDCVSETGERELQCSCCGVSLKPPSELLGATQVENDAGDAVLQGNGEMGDRRAEEEQQDEDSLGRRVPLELIDSSSLLSEKDGDAEVACDLLEREYTEAVVVSVPNVDVMDDGILRINGIVDVGEEHSSGLAAEELAVGLSTDKEVILAIVEDRVGIEVKAVVADQDSGVGTFSVDFADSAALVERPISLQLERDDDGGFGLEQTVAFVPVIGNLDDCTQSVGVIDVVKENQFVTNDELIGDNSSDNHLVVLEEINAVSEDAAGVETEMFPDAEDFGGVQGIASEDEGKVIDAETNCEVSIGSEICDQELADPPHLHELAFEPLNLEFRCLEDYNEEADTDQALGNVPVDNLERDQYQLPIFRELNEIEEERMPETPSSMDGTPAPHRGYYFEMRGSGIESLDGSVASEVEGSEALTVDRLRAALKAKSIALSSVYAELEEERSASAIAANQTMAMITRLQEEKSAMQMEALQYQRMMEELSEYDQEALQLTNELMAKREKEKEDLEKELQLYRHKVLLYESEERRKISSCMPKGRSESYSASLSAEDSDDISLDCHGSFEFFSTLVERKQSIQIDGDSSSGDLPDSEKHLMTFDESLADFEEERLAILERLKSLEEKLIMLDDDDSSNDLDSMEHIVEENGHAPNGDYGGLGNDGIAFLNGFSNDLHVNGKLSVKGRNIGCRGKRLLPLFDATSTDIVDTLCTRPEETDASAELVSVSKSATDRKRFSIAEEVDKVYQRLQVLEADGEFLKHCISSLKKGDKGTDLLQEILQHLRGLRNVELRVRNAGDSLDSLSD